MMVAKGTVRSLMPEGLGFILIKVALGSSLRFLEGIEVMILLQSSLTFVSIGNKFRSLMRNFGRMRAGRKRIPFPFLRLELLPLRLEVVAMLAFTQKIIKEL